MLGAFGAVGASLYRQSRSALEEAWCWSRLVRGFRRLPDDLAEDGGEWRDGESAFSTPVVFVHGAAHNRSAWAALAERLRMAGFGRLVALDYRMGHEPVEALAIDLGRRLQRVRERTGAERVHVIGHTAPPIYVAAAGEQAAELAGRVGDGLIATAPLEGTIKTFDGAGGEGKPHIGQVMACWAATEAEGKAIAHEWWPNEALPGQLGQELLLPMHFEQATSLLEPDDVADQVVCGPDADRHVEAIEGYVAAGYEQVYVHQIGPDQAGFFDFYEKAVLPRFSA